MAAIAGILLLACLILPGMVLADTHLPGETVDVALTIVNPVTGQAISGEAPTAAIYRCSDGYYWDWSSSTFKASGWTTQYSALAEIGTTGRYLSEVDTNSWTEGTYLTILTNSGDNAVDGAVSWILRAVTSDCYGTGQIPINQDYPTANNLQPTNAAGSPISDMLVRVYLASDYDAGHLGEEYVQGSTMTNVLGDWEEPIYVDPADYTVVFSKAGQRTAAVDVTVTE